MLAMVCMIFGWIYSAIVCCVCDIVCPLMTCFCCMIVFMGGRAAANRAARVPLANNVINKLSQ